MKTQASAHLVGSTYTAVPIDYGTLLGIVAAFSLVFFAIILGGGVGSFIDLNSLLIVVGGTLGATLISFPLEDFRKTRSVLRTALYPNTYSVQDRLQKIIYLSRKARINGPLSLQTDINLEADPFLRKCLELAIDGNDADNIRHMLNLELTLLEDRHQKGAQIFQTMGSIAPAMGLIGTLIGLVQMLQHVDDPSKIGPGMAVALLTTFYGAILAHLVFLPLAGKLRRRSQEEAHIKEMTIEGIIGIVTGTNPILVEQHLLSFLPPEERRSQFY